MQVANLEHVGFSKLLFFAVKHKSLAKLRKLINLPQTC